MALLQSQQTLKKGDTAPNFHLKGIDGKIYSLASFNDANALLIVFMCNHCPYVRAKFDVMKGLVDKYGKKGLTLVGINSNDPVKYPDDSFENMKKTAKEQGFNFVYIFDDTQDVARAYGAVCTPDPFLFDKKRTLVYHGRLNNAMSPDHLPTQHDMDDVIGDLISGRKIAKDFLPSQGCSIKWKD